DMGDEYNYFLLCCIRISSALRESPGNKSAGIFFLPNTIATLYLAHFTWCQRQYSFFIVSDAAGIFSK
ncbi:MAG: hypothetical protein KAI99_10650, partial [Cyclobacteriaceae bacterium]|nr:hypothetical protein [Cyclobacteriaceae bacterium]